MASLEMHSHRSRVIYETDELNHPTPITAGCQLDSHVETRSEFNRHPFSGFEESLHVAIRGIKSSNRWGECANIQG
jgi:hypothetical protein